MVTERRALWRNVYSAEGMLGALRKWVADWKTRMLCGGKMQVASVPFGVQWVKQPLPPPPGG